MIRNELHTTFPFYDTIDKQNHRKINCDGDYFSWKLITPNDRFLPFQLKREMSPDYLTTFLLWCADDSDSLDITAIMNTSDIDYATVGGFDYITYYGNLELLSELECGNFYLEVTDGTNTWFSEVFNVQDFTDTTSVTYRAVSKDTIRAVDGNDLRII